MKELTPNDPALRIRRLRVVTVDYYFHAFNLMTFWMWFSVAGFAAMYEPTLGLFAGVVVAHFAVRVYRWMREDWSGIKEDLFS